MKLFQANIIALEIPKFCLHDDSYLKFTWFFKNEEIIEPKVQLYFKSYVKFFSFINLKFYRTNAFLLEVSTENFTNLIKTVWVRLQIKKVLRSYGFFDFNYLSKSNLKIYQGLNKISGNRSFEKNPYDFYKKFNGISVDLIPINFIKSRQYKQSFNFDKKILNWTKGDIFYSGIFFNGDQELNPLGLDRRSLFALKSKSKNYVDFKIDSVPKSPLLNNEKSLRLVPSFALGFILRLYKHRPIWTKKGIEKYLPISIKKHLKMIFPLISYRFIGINPFKGTWLRYGFEVRKNPKTRIYQTLGFDEIKKEGYLKNKNYQGVKYVKKSNSKKKHERNTIHVPILSTIQICDFNELEFNKICSLKSSKHVTSSKGWLI